MSELHLYVQSPVASRHLHAWKRNGIRQDTELVPSKCSENEDQRKHIVAVQTNEDPNESQITVQSPLESTDQDDDTEVMGEQFHAENTEVIGEQFEQENTEGIDHKV